MERKGHGLRSWMHVLVPRFGMHEAHLPRMLYSSCLHLLTNVSNRNLKPETMKSSMHSGEWRRNGQETKKYYFLVIGAPPHKRKYIRKMNTELRIIVTHVAK